VAAVLAEAQGRTEAWLDRLEQAVEKLAERMDRLTAVVEKLVFRSDCHEGMLLELKFRDRLPSYIGRYLLRAKVLQPADLLDELEASLESAEVDDFLRADVLAQGTVNGESQPKGAEPAFQKNYFTESVDFTIAVKQPGGWPRGSTPAGRSQTSHEAAHQILTPIAYFSRGQ